MPNLIEDRLASLLAEWIDSNRPVGFPDSSAVPILVANRDELRTRPCVVLEAELPNFSDTRSSLYSF